MKKNNDSRKNGKFLFGIKVETCLSELMSESDITNLMEAVSGKGKAAIFLSTKVNPADFRSWYRLWKSGNKKSLEEIANNAEDLAKLEKFVKANFERFALHVWGDNLNYDFLARPLSRHYSNILLREKKEQAEKAEQITCRVEKLRKALYPGWDQMGLNEKRSRVVVLASIVTAFQDFGDDQLDIWLAFRNHRSGSVIDEVEKDNVSFLDLGKMKRTFGKVADNNAKKILLNCFSATL